MLPSGFRDEKYYFEDGSIVIIIQCVLFKIHRSLLSSHSDFFEAMFKLPIHQSLRDPDSPVKAEEGTDQNPLAIPNVTAGQFRNFLLYVYGTATNSEYRALIQDPTAGSAHSLVALKRYIDVASVAHRFCIEDIELWALGQLERLLKFSRQLSKLSWGYSDIIDTLTYSKLTSDDEIQAALRNLVYRSVLNQYLQCLALSDHEKPSDTYTINRFNQLYTNPTLKMQDPALFGFVFCLVLSAGHQSSIWKSMNRNERAELYAACVHLTPLPSALPLCVWLNDYPQVTCDPPNGNISICLNACEGKFFEKASSIISRADFFKNSPLTGLKALCRLPARRQQLEALKVLHSCECPGKFIEAIDLRLDASFKIIAGKHRDYLD